MKHLSLLLLWATLLTSLALAQAPDSVALRVFNDKYGPAEGIVSFAGSPAYRFRTGTYSLNAPDFPLWSSPDSLVQHPFRRSARQQRKAKVVTRATVVPLVVLTYCGLRLVLSLGAAASGQSTNLDHVHTLLPIGGIGSVAGITLGGTFNIASVFSQRKGIKRHNQYFGRKPPTLFNPRGL
jgi:hypothetical protein